MLATKDPGDYLFRRLRLRHVQLLALLEESGSVRAAADRLSLSQPAVSKMLSEVESAFGVRLFDRGRRGVVANAYGRAAIHRARVVLHELLAATQELQAMRGGGGGLLRLGTLSVTDIVPAAVARLLERLPGSCVQISEGRVQDLITQLLDGKLDCVFGALVPAAIESQPIEELDVAPIFEDRLCVLVNERHALAGRRQLRWSDLAEQDWVAPPRSTLVRQAFISAFTNLGLPVPVPVVEVLSPVTQRGILLADVRLTGVVRYENGRQGVTQPGLKMLDVAPSMALPPLCAFTRRSELAVPQVVNVFVEELKRVAAGNARSAAPPRSRSPRRPTAIRRR